VAPRRVSVNLAGRAFGIDLPSLEAEDDSAETQSVLSEYFPELKLTFGSKSQRGGRLGRQTVSVTPEIALRQREAAAAGSAAPISTSVQQPAPTPTPTPAPTPTAAKRVPTTRFGISDVYFGGEDYWRNIEQGVTPQEIKDWAQSNPQLFREQNVKGNEEGLYEQIMRGNVRVQSGLTPQPAAPTPAPAPAPSPAPSPTPSFSNPLQTQEFRSAETAPKTKGPISAAYGIDPGYFGGEDVTAAKNQGYTAQEIFDYIDRNQNLLREQNVRGGGGLYDMLRQEAGR
jgi:hypothetical protein